MAIAAAKCQCATCGAEFVREKRCRSRVDAERWEEWAADHYNQRTDCWKAEQRENERKEGLYADVRADASMAAAGSEFVVAIVFGGDTMSNKDAIKSLGACWNSLYPTGNDAGCLLATKEPPKRWVIWATPKNYMQYVEQLGSIGASVKSMPDEAGKIIIQEAARRQKELESVMPDWPEDIKAVWPEGAKWNGKFYGKAGRWSVYFGGQKVTLTDDQKARMEETQNARNAARKSA